MAQPLAGIRVLDLSRMAPGPWGTMASADLGADVVRIEQPGCGVIPPPVEEKTCAAYSSPNRSKRSILRNFKTAEARTPFHAPVNTPTCLLRSSGRARRPGAWSKPRETGTV